jgi:hypothetical protein
MGPSPERVTWRTVFGFFVLALFLAAIVTPVCLWVEPPHRSFVVQLAAGLFCLCVLWRLSRTLRDAAGLDTIAASELALRRPMPRASADPTLLRLAADLRGSLARRRNFDQMLWPRLQEIAVHRGIVLSSNVLPPPRQKVSRSQLEHLLSIIEAGP